MMERIQISDIFGSPEKVAGGQITVAGWVRTIRDSKSIGFIALNDGSCYGNLQVVFEEAKLGEDFKAVAKYNVGAAVIAMTAAAQEKCGELPLVFAGGVMSDVIIRDSIISRYPGASFAAPEFSCDNAAGVAVFGCMKHSGVKKCL